MPDSDDERTSETPAVESPAVAERAPEDELPDLVDVLRNAAKAEAKPAEEAAPASDEAEDEDEEDSDGSEEEAPEEEAAAPEPAPTAQERRPNRLQRTRAELERIKAEHEQTKAELERIHVEQANKQYEAIRALGAEDRWNYLVGKRLNPSEVLTYDEEAEYQRYHEARSEAKPYRDMAWSGTNQKLLNKAAAHGITLNVPNLAAVDPEVVAEHLISAGEERGREESKDTIARLEADNQSLLTKLAGKSKDPGVGGRSAAGRADMPAWDDADPQDFFKAAQRQAAGAKR